MACRTDLPRDITVEGFDLDDVGAVVAEHLGGIGPHQHGRHVDDLDALQRSHWLGSLPMRAASSTRGSSNVSASGRSRAAGVWPYASRDFVGWAKRSVPTALRFALHWWARRKRAFAHPTA